MIRDTATVSATGYARTDGREPTVVLRLSPGRSSVAAGVIQVTSRYATSRYVDRLFTFSMVPGSTARFDPAFPPDTMSDVEVHVFEELGSIIVQVVGLDHNEIDWTARVDLVLVAAHAVTP